MCYLLLQEFINLHKTHTNTYKQTTIKKKKHKRHTKKNLISGADSPSTVFHGKQSPILKFGHFPQVVISAVFGQFQNYKTLYIYNIYFHCMRYQMSIKLSKST